MKEDNPIDLAKLEEFIRSHRIVLSLLFIALIVLATGYLIMNGKEAFSKTIQYDNGFEQCNETYVFGKNTTPLCNITGMYKEKFIHSFPEGFDNISIN
jgi:hypothetical protein